MNSQFDGSAAFAGGGFMPSQSTQSVDPSFSSSSSKNRDSQPLLPLTVKQISEALQSIDDKANFFIDGVDVNNVTLVGLVFNKTERVTDVAFVIDDGTGRIDCIKWNSEAVDNKEMERILNGMYVRVHGHLKGFQGKNKPIAGRLKQQAGLHPRFRQLIVNFAQSNHRFTTKLQRRIYGHATDVKIVPLNEEKAVQAAADLLGEFFFFAVAGAAVIFEWQRSSRSEAKKEEIRKQELEVMRLRDEELKREVEYLRKKLEEVEQLARSGGLAGVFSFKNVTASAIAEQEKAAKAA